MRNINASPNSSRLTDKLSTKAKESRTLGQLLGGETNIRLVAQDSLIERPNGVLYHVSTHEVSFPGLNPDGTDWTTYLSHWVPLPGQNDNPYRQLGAELTILTGEGDIPYSRDEEVNKAVLGEIHRQEASAAAQAS